ncbi:BNR repeat-containing protein [Pedobacter chitinilyticus]|uniref:Neuraminidase n=1 Tax=Pedobacter chitinilyticus TaxID=2233776 RepID=A0A443YKH7_9SPHI|nr:BNR repeat-containing protein [Pedobacter chitinilyticus]RWU04256.1 neuraminidase [Pedobacter chitinilyticus]
MRFKSLTSFLILFLFSWEVDAQKIEQQTIAGNGWANNSVNTVIFRKNALTTFKDYQYTAYYDHEQYVVLAKRKLNSWQWEVSRTAFKGDANDAHKSISIMVDGKGFLHLAWGQHNNNLNYAKSVAPQVLAMGNKEKMIGKEENKVSYPEFYKLANGKLLFFYRDGGSGNGSLMINLYDSKAKAWKRIQNNLISGEGKRNAYTQTTVDAKGVIHISWVWRESPNVASNHDLCYAKSSDGGITWHKSTGEKYTLPITLENAEYALKIPQESELINQTAMATDADGNPFIATYWRPQGTLVPQYHVVYHLDGKWQVSSLNFRTNGFTLSGGGTKKIPISRPQLVVWQKDKTFNAALLFRDVERGNKVSMALSQGKDLNKWEVFDLSKESVGEWEPSYDTELWLAKKQLSIFVQEVEQVDGEGNAEKKPTALKVLNWKP